MKKKTNGKKYNGLNKTYSFSALKVNTFKKLLLFWDNAYFFQYFKQIVNLSIAKRLVCLPEYKKFFSFEITHALFQIGKVVKKLNQKQPLQDGNPNLGLKKE